MRATLLAALTTALISQVLPAQATAAKPAERGVYLTIFRSPATGIELRSGHAAAYAGFYPTILGRDGERGNVNFIRAGATYYMKDRGASPYISPSLLWSLSPNWKNGALTEIGFRGQLYRRLSGRIGGAVLTTFDNQVRVNPTIGLDIPLGAGR
jgi:hypothetical protein